MSESNINFVDNEMILSGNFDNITDAMELENAFDKIIPINNIYKINVEEIKKINSSSMNEFLFFINRCSKENKIEIKLDKNKDWQSKDFLLIVKYSNGIVNIVY